MVDSDRIPARAPRAQVRTGVDSHQQGAEEVMVNQTEAFVTEHGQYLKDYPGQARVLTLTKILPSGPYGNETLRGVVVEQLRSQIVRDAFARGLGIIGVSDPLYRVELYLGLREPPPEPGAYLNQEWTRNAPPAHLLEPDTSVEIMIEAIGFPIRVREV
jgi:hypothetical protein